MTLRIISSTDVLYDGEVDAVTLPGAMGSFTVLAHHAPLVSTLSGGNISYRRGDSISEILAEGGVVDVNNDVVSVCLF